MPKVRTVDCRDTEEFETQQRQPTKLPCATGQCWWRQALNLPSSCRQLENLPPQILRTVIENASPYRGPASRKDGGDRER
ncbi:MAG TPA: hypothetical protein VGG61_14660, partial [Gemmataceae bacterium]